VRFVVIMQGSGLGILPDHVPMQVYTTAWWVRAGTTPVPADAVARLDLLRRLGPTQEPFTVTRPFPPPGSSEVPVVREEWECPV
jgi:hypothetical protein